MILFPVGRGWGRRDWFWKEDAAKVLAGVACRSAGDLFGRPLRHNPSAGGAAFRPKVNHPIGRFYHVQVVLDDEEGVASVAQFEENIQQLGHVVKCSPVVGSSSM